MNPSKIKKHSVHIDGRKTSISLEPEFWDAFREIARVKAVAIGVLVGEIAGARPGGGLSSAIRLHVLAHYRSPAATADMTHG